MVAIKAHFDGRAIIPDEPVDLPAGRALIVHIEAASPDQASDPADALWRLGSDPIDTGIREGSVNHDRFIDEAAD